MFKLTDHLVINLHFIVLPIFSAVFFRYVMNYNHVTHSFSLRPACLIPILEPFAPIIVMSVSVAVLVIVALRREVLFTVLAVVDLYGLHAAFLPFANLSESMAF